MHSHHTFASGICYKKTPPFDKKVIHSIFQLLKTFIFVTLLLLHVAQQGLEYAIAYKVRHSGTFKRISKMQYVGVPRIPPSI